MINQTAMKKCYPKIPYIRYKTTLKITSMYKVNNGSL